jgi:DnaJ-class molecular chaperone
VKWSGTAPDAGPSTGRGGNRLPSRTCPIEQLRASAAGLAAPRPVHYPGRVRDLYVVLGVQRGADTRAIKQAYRELTRRFHPDVNRGREWSEELYREIIVAYTILGDGRTRALYDEFGELSLTRGFDPARARAARKRTRGDDDEPGPAGPPWGSARARNDDPPDAADAADDVEADDVERARRTVFEDILSSFWRGRDVHLDDDGDDGEGMGSDIRAEVSVPLARAVVGCTVQVPVGAPSSGARTVDVAVPAGVEDGAVVRLGGQGQPGSPPGDLHVAIRVLPDPSLTRRGLDLHLEVAVTLLQLYRGGPLDVVTPRGPVSVRLPPACAPDRKLRLRRQGVPGRDGAVGDLYLVFRVQLPPAGDAELLRTLERLQGSRK